MKILFIAILCIIFWSVSTAQTTNVNSCFAEPCRNGGTCVRNGSSNFSCNCVFGYTGDHCENKDVDPCSLKPCRNEGTCVRSDGTDFHCNCIFGYTGDHCEDKAICNSTIIKGKTSGTIESPNYPMRYHNKACYVWNITVPEMAVILVELDDTFDLEDSNGCRYDLLAFDSYGKFCGDSFTNFQTKTNSLNIHFKSDDYATRSGFSISWHAVEWSPWSTWGSCNVTPGGGKKTRSRRCSPKTGLCSGTSSENKTCIPQQCPGKLAPCNCTIIEDGTSGEITSPNHPRNYHDNACYVWNITVPDWMVISVESDTAFDIEENSRCSYDSLTFERHGKHCGDSLTNFQTKTNSLNVIFKSDGSVTGLGFSILWRAVGATCPKLKEPANGYILEGRHSDTVTYGCEGGFMLNGPSRRRCRPDKKWSGHAPLCFRITCPTLQKPTNGRIFESGRSYNDTVTYGCEEGFMLTGPSTRRCRSDSKWSGFAPLCVPFSTCGLRGQEYDGKLLPKVIEGTDAEEGAWPWQALFFHNKDDSVSQIYNMESRFAGGTIIHKEWILTAAHVFDQFFPWEKDENWRKLFLIAVGMTTIPSTGSVIPEYIHILAPETVFIHPKYDTINLDYDAALIRVGRKLIPGGNQTFMLDNNLPNGGFVFSRYIRPVCLPCMKAGPLDHVDLLKNYDREKCSLRGKPSTAAVGSYVIITGFGLKRNDSEDNEYLPSVLQEGMLKIVDRQECSESVRDIRLLNPAARFTRRMFCATSADKTANVDSCHGDSGGPVLKRVREDENTEFWTQIGVVSWGGKCGDRHPGFYTSVASIMGSIWQILDEARIGVQCQPVDSPRFGNMTKKPSTSYFEVGSVVKFSCNRGLSLQFGPSSITCKSNGKWSSTETPVCGRWRPWSTWSGCSLSCGVGQKSQSRKCIPAHDLCSGERLRHEDCNTQQCSAFTWTQWVTWTACNSTCGDRGRTRTSKICAPAPKYCKTYSTCSLQHWPACCNSTIIRSGISEKIESPNYPRRYPNRACYVWNITVPEGMAIFVKSESAFDLEMHSTCGYDSLTFEGYGKYCGDSFTNFQTETNSLIVTFTSDAFKTGLGFAISWRAVDYWEDWSTWTKCSATCGGGKTKRLRICIGSVKCVGKPNEAKPCNSQSCSDLIRERRICAPFEEYCHLPQIKKLCPLICGLPGQVHGIPPTNRDVLFIVDESSSVGATNFRSLMVLAKFTMDKIDTGGRVGVLTFDSNVYVQRNFTTYDEDTDQTVFTYHKKNPGKSCFTDALVYADSNMFTSAERQGLVIIFTDGCEYCGTAGELEQIAKNLSRKNVLIIMYFVEQDTRKCDDISKDLTAASDCNHIFPTKRWDTFEEDLTSDGHRRRFTEIVTGLDQCT